MKQYFDGLGNEVTLEFHNLRNQVHALQLENEKLKKALKKKKKLRRVKKEDAEK